MGIAVSDVIQNNLISDDIMYYIPIKCEYCGSDIHFTDSLRQIYCPNRYCAVKVAARLESMAKYMKADGWGESTCREVCRRFHLKSPYQVFLLEGKECNTVAAFGKKMKSICETEKRTVTLWEVVKLANIPSVETVAYKIFDGYKNLSEAYNDIEKMQVPFIAEKLGIKSSDTSVLAVNIYNTLIEYKSELLFGETKFHIYEPKGMRLRIAITGGVDGYTNKSQFISYINNRYDGVVHAVLINSVSSNIHILVADSDTSSNKYKTACRLREKGHKIMITDSGGLIEWLDKHKDKIAESTEDEQA